MCLIAWRQIVQNDLTRKLYSQKYEKQREEQRNQTQKLQYLQHMILAREWSDRYAWYLIGRINIG